MTSDMHTPNLYSAVLLQGFIKWLVFRIDFLLGQLLIDSQVHLFVFKHQSELLKHLGLLQKVERAIILTCKVIDVQFYLIDQNHSEGFIELFADRDLNLSLLTFYVVFIIVVTRFGAGWLLALQPFLGRAQFPGAGLFALQTCTCPAASRLNPGFLCIQINPQFKRLFPVRDRDSVDQFVFGFAFAVAIQENFLGAHKAKKGCQV